MARGADGGRVGAAAAVRDGMMLTSTLLPFAFPLQSMLSAELNHCKQSALLSSSSVCWRLFACLCTCLLGCSWRSQSILKTFFYIPSTFPLAHSALANHPLPATRPPRFQATLNGSLSNLFIKCLAVQRGLLAEEEAKLKGVAGKVAKGLRFLGSVIPVPYASTAVAMLTNAATAQQAR